MAFDISTAKPIQGGFDINSAKPFEPQQPEEQENLSYFDKMKARNSQGIENANNMYKAIEGNAEFKDAGSFESWLWTRPNYGYNKKDISTTAAGMFGTDKDKFKSFVKQNPNVQLKLDNAQNPYFEDKGKKFYLDMPGLDIGDIADFMGEGGTYALAGGITAPLAKGTALAKSMPKLGQVLESGLSKTAATSIGQGGANIANQMMAGRDEVDLGETAGVMASAGIFDQGGQLINKVRNARAGNTNLPKAKEDIVNYANKEKLPLAFDDITENPLARRAGQQFDAVSGKFRRAQNSAQMAKAQEVTNKFTLPDSNLDDLYDAVSGGAKNHMKRSKDIAKQKYSIIEKKLDNAVGEFNVPELKQKAQSIIDEQLTKGSAANKPVIQAMQDYMDIPDGNFSHWKNIRSGVISKTRDLEGSLSGKNKELETALKQISKQLNISMDDVANNGMKTVKPSYKGQHTAPMNEDGNGAGHALDKIFGDDIYTANAKQYYGTGSGLMDNASIRTIQEMKGNPDSLITVYRAVPKGVKGVNKGDWITINKRYAKLHGDSNLSDGYDIVSQRVKAKDLYSDGNSIHEFGYDPVQATATQASKPHNPQLAKEWRNANEFYKNAVVRYTKPALKNAMKEDNPDKLLDLFMNKGSTMDNKKMANTRFNALDKQGKAAVRQGIMQKAYDDALTDVGDFSAAKYATNLKKYENRLGVVLSKEDKQAVKGLRRYMRATQTASGYGRNTPTGEKAIPALYTGLAVGGANLSMPITTAVLTGAATTKKLFRTVRGRSFLLAMSKYPDGKKPPPQLLTDIARYLAVKPSEE